MTAVISDCGRYRYTLEREWMTGVGTCLFVMLNPSTADASEDDPTIRRCIGFAQRWGYRRLTVGNLFAYRATDPRALGNVGDPTGPDNYRWLGRLVAEADRVIAAWGATAGSAAKGGHVDWLLADAHCLGTTKGGHPRHPLYVPGDFEPVPFTQFAEAA